MAKRSYFEEVSELNESWDRVWKTVPNISEGLKLDTFAGLAYCIGSGGSLVLARIWQQIHEAQKLGIARVMTPYDFAFCDVSPDVVVLFSASGRNHDILQVFKTALDKGCRIVVFTIKNDSQLMRLVRSHSDRAWAVYPSVKVSGDGFLAVNSIVVLSCLIRKIEMIYWGSADCMYSPIQLAISDYENNPFVMSTNIQNVQIVVSERGIPAGYDLETRLSESGTASCFVTDPRSFGHGRFIWLEKSPCNTVVLVINTSLSARFNARFIRLLPENVQLYHIESQLQGTMGAIYCVAMTTLLFADMARSAGIDPGQPEVPEWGRKLHRLSLTYKDMNESIRINRLLHYPVLNTSFSGLVIDIDGTLVNTNSRTDPVSSLICEQITRLLNLGMRFSFATGRGSSGIDVLKSCIPELYWEQIMVGLYNGGIITELSNYNGDFKKMPPWWNQICSVALDLCRDYDVESTMRTSQISIRGLQTKQIEDFKGKIIATLKHRRTYIKVLASGHSIDIVPSSVSKLNVVRAIDDDFNSEIVCIGDQGQVGGNDEELLGWKFAVSVGKHRPASNTCFWLGKNPGYRESDGLLAFLQSVKPNNDEYGFHSDLSRLLK